MRQHTCFSEYMLLPIRLSDRCIIVKRLKFWLWNFHRTVAPSL